MKQKFPALVGLLLCCTFIHAQTINYEKTLEKTKALAIRDKKPIAILITIKPMTASPNFMKGLTDPDVITKFNMGFINYKIAKEDTETSEKIISEYKVTRFPALVFLDDKGGLLFKDVAASPWAAPLLTMADKVFAGMSDMSLVDYDVKFKGGNNEKDFIKKYILKRQTAGLSDNADLIENYVNSLSVSDLNNYEEVLFILKAGPVTDSNAFKLARTNKKVIDSIFKHEPLSDRKTFNNATIYNTLNKAIASKNMTRAMAAANFSRSTYGNNYTEGHRSMQAIMLQYYLGAKDTMQYLRNAVSYFDNYYMTMSMDSVRKKDSFNFEAAKRNATVIEEIKVDENVIRRTSSFAYAKDTYATALNNAAWNFFKLGGDSNEYLVKAMLWSKRSIEHNAKAAYYDTYAHILYKLKLYSEAETMQRKAIESAKSEKIDAAQYIRELEKIKNKSL